jgi:hypothetical protein
MPSSAQALASSGPTNRNTWQHGVICLANTVLAPSAVVNTEGLMICARHLSLLLPILCTTAFSEVGNPSPKDWHVALETLRADVGLPDISERKNDGAGVWRFTYLLSLAIDSPNIVTVEEQLDGTAMVLVTTENPAFQAYRVNEYERAWICGLPEDEQTFLHCPSPYQRPIGSQFETDRLVASRDDVARLRSLIAVVPVCDEPDAPEPSDPNVVYVEMDGSDWMFETADAGKYCSAHRHSPGYGERDPNGKAFRQLGLYFALLAQGKIFPM